MPRGFRLALAACVFGAPAVAHAQYPIYPVQYAPPAPVMVQPAFAPTFGFGPPVAYGPGMYYQDSDRLLPEVDTLTTRFMPITRTLAAAARAQQPAPVPQPPRSRLALRRANAPILPAELAPTTATRQP